MTDRSIINAICLITNKMLKLCWKERTWPRVLRVLSCWWVLYCQKYNDSVLLTFIKLISKWISCNGLAWSIDHVKTIRLHATRWIADSPITDNSFRIKVDNTGWPMCLRFIKPVKGDLEHYKRILTLLCILRSFEGGKKEDLNPITAPINGVIRDSLINYCDQFARRVRKTNLKPWGIHFTTKIGPNGHALASSISDARVMTPEIIQACNSISPGIGVAIDNYRALITKRPVEVAMVTDSRPVISGTERLARIVSIPAPEGKTRVIAQQGYFVQAALKPLHEALMSTLKMIPQDLTFSQWRGPTRLKITPGNIFHSLDLTSATDRFPIELQARLLESIYSRSLASGWVTLIRLPHYFDESNKEVVYKCGQPMGAYSSWCTFTLCHHIVVQWCIRRVNPENKACYIILGDDIVISEDRVAKLYLRVIDEIGVKISVTKSHTSPHSFEIAKRWYKYREGEYSPFAINSIVKAGTKTAQVYQGIHESLVKGWMNSHSVSRVTALMTTAYRTGKQPNYGIYPHNRKLASLYDIVAKVIRGFIPGVEMIRGFQNTFNLPILPALSPSHYVNNGVMNNIVVELFSESVEQKGSGHQNVAISTICWLTDPSTEIPISVDEAIACIPQLGVYAKFEETFMRIHNRVIIFDTLFNGEWDIEIRSLLVPDTTTVFSARNNDVRSIITSLLVKKVSERVKTIAHLPNGI